MNVLTPDSYVDGLPHSAYARLRAEAPCSFETLDEPRMLPGAWVLSRYEDVRNAVCDATTFISGEGVSLKTVAPFSPRQGGKPAMLCMDGEDHARNRGVVSRAFTPRVVRTFEHRLRELARRFADTAVAMGKFDFADLIASDFVVHGICDLVGVPDEDRSRFLEWTDTVIFTTDPENAPSLEAAMDAMRSLFTYGATLAAHRRTSPSDDLLSTIVHAADEDVLSEDEVTALTFLLLAAGTETTRTALSHGLNALVQHPDQMAWVREHLDPLPDGVIDELLRYASPVVLVRRTAAAEVELHGQIIARGDRVALLLASANFDDAEFVDPQTFDIQRDPNRHLTFSAGPHFCLGAHLARVELRVLFEELLARTRSIELAGPIRYARDSYVRAVSSLPVRVVPV